MEVWKPVPGFGGHYMASSEGRIKTLPREVWKLNGKVRQFYKERILTQKPDKAGYVYVHISVGNSKIRISAHRLVALAWHGPCPDGFECCHNNGNASDNRPANLRWDTHFANNRDRKAHGNYPMGTRHPMAKFPDSVIQQVVAQNMPRKLAMSTFGISHSHYYRIIRGEHTRPAS